MAQTTQMTKSPDYRSTVQKTSDALLPMITEQLKNHGVNPDAYQRQCMLNAIAAMNDVAMAANISINDIDRNTLTEILQQVATLRLNPFSQPRECYFQTRNKKVSQDNWVTTVEMGIEGDGNDAILRNFGHGVEEVYPFWDVREFDEFTYPTYRGIEVEPPTWTQSGKGKFVRVVYPIKFKDGSVRYFISEREDVRANLVAHVSNNMMNETFGIVKKRYDATVEQRAQIDVKKNTLKALMDGKDIDEILDIPELQAYISPAWREGSRERMILRKMRNNAIKPIPKDFSNGMALSMYNNAQADVDDRPREERAPVTVDIPEDDYRELAERKPLPEAATEQPAAPPAQERKPDPTAMASKVPF